MYRPTVRYSDVYKEYVDAIFKSTSLDRNQIIRLALFSAPFNRVFINQLEKHMTSPLPSPKWEAFDHGLWLDQQPNLQREEGDVSEKDVTNTERKTSATKNGSDIRERPQREDIGRKIQTIERRKRAVHKSKKITPTVTKSEEGGIKIFFG